MIIIQRDFKVLDPEKTYEHRFYYQSWYSSIFLKNRQPDDNEESCCVTFQVRKDREGKNYLVLANILLPDRFDSYQVMTHLKNLNDDFTNNTLKEMPSTYTQNLVIIPAVENEPNSFAHEAQMDNIPIQRLYIEGNGGSLEGMVNRAINLIKKKRFLLVRNPKNKNVFRPLDERFLELIIRYPSNDAYAIAYAWAQGLIYGERYMGLFEDKRKEKSSSIKHGFYGVDL